MCLCILVKTTTPTSRLAEKPSGAAPKKRLPRDYYIEWSKSQTEKQLSHTDAYIWNLERWSWWTHLQSSSGDTDKENRLMDTAWGGQSGEGGRFEDSNTETYVTICKIDSKWEFAVWLRELKEGLWDNLEGCDGEGGSGGRRYGSVYPG